MTTDNIEYLDKMSIENIVSNSEGIVFVECYKYSKGPLFIIEPIMKKLHQSGMIQFKQYRVNLLEQPEIEVKYQIVVVPCYLVFNDHILIDKIYGVTAFHEYINKIIE